MKKSHPALWSANVDLKKNSQLKKFCDQLEKKGFFRNKYNFRNLWKWSIKNNERFWSEVWDFTKIKGIKIKSTKNTIYKKKKLKIKKHTPKKKNKTKK